MCPQPLKPALLESGHLALSPHAADGSQPLSWADRAAWTVLDIDFGAGRDFIKTWRAWKADPQRPRMLHYVAIRPDTTLGTGLATGLAPKPRAGQNAPPLKHRRAKPDPRSGFHRFSFEGGQVLLTLCAGGIQAMLREMDFEADHIRWPLHQQSSLSWQQQTHLNLWLAQLLARRCHVGSTLALQCDQANPDQVEFLQHLRNAGFEWKDAGQEAGRGAGPESKRETTDTHHLVRFNPSWTTKRRVPQRDHARLVAQLLPSVQGPVQWPCAPVPPRDCLIIGAGLAGACTAAALARRGWQVRVLDAAALSAQGASGVPVALVVPYVSKDDSPQARLSRHGTRLTLTQAKQHLKKGVDWCLSGVKQINTDPAGLPPLARLHRQAGWIKPAPLIAQWLAQPGVVFQGNTDAAALSLKNGVWHVRDAQGSSLASSPVVILACAMGTEALLTPLQAAADAGVKVASLKAVNGQISWGLQTAAAGALLPQQPVNGLGHLIAHVPTTDGLTWYAGATHEPLDRGRATSEPAQHEVNFKRLQVLLPEAAKALQAQFESGEVKAWQGTRCTTSYRLPLVGATDLPGLWVHTALGSRGLSWCVLTAEVLAAKLCGEPLPIEASLAAKMAVLRPVLPKNE